MPGKEFIIRNKEVILYPGTDKERNLTKEGAECEICKRKPQFGECEYEKGDSYPGCKSFYAKELIF